MTDVVKDLRAEYLRDNDVREELQEIVKELKKHDECWLQGSDYFEVKDRLFVCIETLLKQYDLLERKYESLNIY